MMGWCCCFGACVETVPYGRSSWQSKVFYLMVDGKWERQEEEGLESQYPLQGVVPNDLISFYWAPSKGNLTFQ